ncbi:MAG: hypothetical protein KC493_02320 [Bacteriovoracaceae bacterium]|nr:hypothetical protein [Bacteriovoracaceae bacterium]
MKSLIKNAIVIASITLILTFSGFLYFKGGEFVASFLLPVWSPPVVAVFPTDIKIKKNDCNITIPVEIEGAKYKFLLDTNRPFSMGVLDKLKFKKTRIELIPGVFGFGLVENIKIGTMGFRHVRLPLLGNKKIKGFRLNNIPEGYDGVLGNDFIFNVNLTLDLKRGTARLNKPLSKPLGEKVIEVKMKTDLIPLLPLVSVDYLGKEVKLQLKTSEQKTFIRFKEHLAEQAVEESKGDEEADPTAVTIGNESIYNFKKTKNSFTEKYIGPDGVLGCEMLKYFSKVGLDYKSGRLFVVL